MKRIKLKKIIPYALAATLVLSGCEKAECENPTRHVHRYTKEISKEITLETYFESEKITKEGYDWTKNILTANSKDVDFYNILDKNNLISAKKNWDYLYHVMSNHFDYLMFYYEYTTTEISYTTDANGNQQMILEDVQKNDWHNNPWDSDNTGKTRVYHHRYFAYRVIDEEGILKIEKSPLVDDIREVLDEYPYIKEECSELVFQEYNFEKWQLPNLIAKEITPFKGPDLNQKESVLIKK